MDHLTKMKVLALQELQNVNGGAMAGPQAWSAMSLNCGGVEQELWSTNSNDCPKETVIKIP